MHKEFEDVSPRDPMVEMQRLLERVNKMKRDRARLEARIERDMLSVEFLAAELVKIAK